MDEHLSEETLNAYLDGELAGGARRAADAHLQGCVHCRERLAVLEALFQRLEELRWPALERDLAPEVVGALPMSRPRSRLPGLLGPLLQGAGGLLLLVLALGQLRPDLSGALHWGWQRWAQVSVAMMDGLREVAAAAGDFALAPLGRLEQALGQLAPPANGLWMGLLAATILWLVANPLLLSFGRHRVRK